MGQPGEWFDTNRERAGELFVYSLWICGQMADLLIFKDRPDLVEPFLESPGKMPDEFVRLRLEAWQDDFTPTKAKFIEAFSDVLTQQDLADLDFLNSLRNAIAHSHVSIGRDYFLYRPRTQSERQVIEGLALESRDDAMQPAVVKIAFYDDGYYFDCFAHITRLDQECFARVATAVGVKHSRIR
jgi:hypothetical protein